MEQSKCAMGAPMELFLAGDTAHRPGVLEPAVAVLDAGATSRSREAGQRGGSELWLNPSCPLTSQATGLAVPPPVTCEVERMIVPAVQGLQEVTVISLG